MLPSHAVLLFSAAVFAGALNSVAGGGGFIAFPALLFAGIPPISANATNTIALWPGTVAATGAYRRELEGREKWRPIVPLLFVSLLGALVGAHLLLRTPQATFMKMVPWLLLSGTVLFTFGGAITGWMRRRAAEHHHATRAAQIAVIVLQLVVAIYIGFFGAGAGILMLALLALMGMENIHTMNGFKNFRLEESRGGDVTGVQTCALPICGRDLYWIFRRRRGHPHARPARHHGDGKHSHHERLQDLAGLHRQRRCGGDLYPRQSRRLAAGPGDDRGRRARRIRRRMVGAKARGAAGTLSGHRHRRRHERLLFLANVTHGTKNFHLHRISRRRDIR